MGRPNKEKYQISAKSTGSQTGEILVYGDITDYGFYEEDVTPTRFNEAIESLGKDVKEVTIRYNCYGGSVYAGLAMVAMIRNMMNRGVTVTSKVDGIAASMAATLFQIAHKRVISRNASFMIHKPQSFAIGNANEMESAKERLDKAEDSLVDIFMENFKGTEEELRALLEGKSDGTFLSAKEALDYGFADEIDEPIEIAASAKFYTFNGLNVPREMFKDFENKIEPTIEAKKGGEKDMLLNEKQIAEIESLLKDGKEVSISYDEEAKSYHVGEIEYIEMESSVAFLTAEQVEEVAGDVEVTPEQALSSVKALIDEGFDLDNIADSFAKLKPLEGAIVDEETESKAKAYDKIRKEAIEAALTNGVKALGEKFDRELNAKVLEVLDLDEIKAQGEQWLETAEVHAKAGRGRVSEPKGNERKTVSKHVDEYLI